jgi:hypothetical protein
MATQGFSFFNASAVVVHCENRNGMQPSPQVLQRRMFYEWLKQ